MKLNPQEKIDIDLILKDLDKYKPRRSGWTWRDDDCQKYGDYCYSECSGPLNNSIPLPAAHFFGNIDPQPKCIITTEIASGRFEDDIRRMRMAAWHGADHIMVIRTMGQSHFDGLIEGTPEGVGGVPITRKQIRASRKALDLIEDEVGRLINFHSYISGLAGPEIAVLFAEEGVNGAHQDPQYNVLYRNINMMRSFVDAAEAKRIMASVNMLQIDGAHNANATALEAWKICPELFVQHAINSMYSVKVGIAKEYIALSTVPPMVSPTPKLKLDLPYAIALRQLFKEYKIRAQMNTRYIESDTKEATINHVLDLFITKLAGADIQSTITPDEGRNVPWHYNTIIGINTAKQTLVGLDGIMEMIDIKLDGILRDKIRELKERAVLFMENILEVGGYFQAVAQGFFVDSGYFPDRIGDGIVREINRGIGADSIFKRDEDYMAPVCNHFGYNNIPESLNKPCELIKGCTICNHEKIIYIDELDSGDNVQIRLEKNRESRIKKIIRPEVEWSSDGVVVLTLFLPTEEKLAHYASLEIAKKLGLKNAEVIHKQVLHPAEGTVLELKAKLDFDLDLKMIEIPVTEDTLSVEKIREEVKKRDVKIIAATVGQDEHSVGMREIIDIKHGGLEGFGIKCYYLGTSVSIKKVIDAAIEVGAHAILISTIISHNDVHIQNMIKTNNLCVEMGLREKIMLIAGGPQVTNEMARECGFNAGFGRKTKGIHVANLIVKKLMKDNSV